MNKKEQEFLEALLEGEISFPRLTEAYVAYLDHERREQRDQLADNAVLLAVMKKPKLWRGTKEALQKKLDDAIRKHDLFNFFGTTQQGGSKT